jgi:DNA (cytosine-5)-methyltransferase 1
MTKSEITLGSLFDGIGGFPFCASFFDINAVWASEIKPNAISLTKKHFPNMKHLGDITKIDGGKIEPVDIITFGSPCQSFSIAGPRTGLNGKSGLFYEATRIIREMRRETHGKHPRIVVFENVLGVLSSRSDKESYPGRDYQAILEEICETQIPMPESGRWADAGMVRGGGFNLAWRVRDAQYHSTAQRRKRLFLVIDFTGSGNGAAKIQFIEPCMSGYFAARGGTEKNNPAASKICAHGKNYGDDLYHCPTDINDTPTYPSSVFASSSDQSNASLNENISPTLTTYKDRPYLCATFLAGQAGNSRSIAYSETAFPTLKGASSGLNQAPSILCIPNKAKTLLRRFDSSPCLDRGANIIALFQDANASNSNNLPLSDDRRNPEGLVVVDTHPNISGTLVASGAGCNRPAGNYNETDLIVAQTFIQEDKSKQLSFNFNTNRHKQNLF